MGHHPDPNKHAAHRDAVVLQRRIATFLLVFSVLIIAIAMTFSAVQYREAPCQDRAHEIVFDLFVKPSISRDDVVTVLQGVLSERRGTLDMFPRNDDVARIVQVDVLDTPTHSIASRGFRLLRRTDGSRYRYELSAVFNALCDSSASTSMEVMANVDYERVQYRIKGIALLNGTVQYLQQSALYTKEKDRVTSVTQLLSVFPGFHQFGLNSARLSPTMSIRFASEGVSQVYFNGSPLDIQVSMQRWLSDTDKLTFWRVQVSTQNILAERDIASLQKSIQYGFATRGMLCNETLSECAPPLDVYLR